MLCATLPQLKKKIMSGKRKGCFFVCLFLPFLRATLEAYGGSQARGLIGAVAAGLHHSHSKVRSMRSEPRLQPTPWLRATPDP